MNKKLESSIRKILSYVMEPKRRRFILASFVICDISIVSFRGLWAEAPSDILFGIAVFTALEYTMLWNWTYIGILKYTEKVPFSHAFARLALMFFYLFANLCVFFYGNLR